MATLCLGIQPAGASPGSVSEDSLLSSESPTISAESPPVRMSHAFFDHPLTARISASGAALDASEPVRWAVIRPTTASADGESCATVSSPEGAASLCFKVMNDVDSLGFNSREMSVSGIEQIARRLWGAPCKGAGEWKADLSSTARVGSGVSVRFIAQPADPRDCGEAPRQLELSLQAL